MESNDVNARLLRIELESQMQNALLIALAAAQPDRARVLVAFRAHADPIERAWATVSGILPRECLDHAARLRAQIEHALAGDDVAEH